MDFFWSLSGPDIVNLFLVKKMGIYTINSNISKSNQWFCMARISIRYSWSGFGHYIKLNIKLKI